MATSESSEEFSKDVEKLKGDIEALRKDVATIARALKDLGVSKGREAYDRAEALGERARKRASDAEERISHEIEERPFASVLTAFGVGFVIGKLLDSGR
jgi:ElaB/YqjD/DUF883 family membrane-anchored ribosome-binding protein